jgi:hypothetical protein
MTVLHATAAHLLSTAILAALPPEFLPLLDFMHSVSGVRPELRDSDEAILPNMVNRSANRLKPGAFSKQKRGCKFVSFSTKL